MGLHVGSERSIWRLNRKMKPLIHQKTIFQWNLGKSSFMLLFCVLETIFRLNIHQSATIFQEQQTFERVTTYSFRDWVVKSMCNPSCLTIDATVTPTVDGYIPMISP